MMSFFILQEYLAYPFCALDDVLDSLSVVADVDTGAQIVFPDAVMECQIRAQFESRGLNFEDAIFVEYEPI